MRHLHQTPTLCCVALLFLLLATVLVAGQRRTAGTGDKNIRLPRNVLPVRYDVRLFPVMEKGNFTILGRVFIDVQCKMETDRIVLHSLDIIVDPESVKVTEETSLLYDDEKSSIKNKERVCEVIAHELAHQWFGNLVLLIILQYYNINY
uniref:Peptidase M1 membrane alanine aminopeptidase domain-containing protein n=1 Tax=Daphnia galeata TaxID=27404 RepID=A0A8J2S1V8_9CRUS|nr:unnamed protein product [Daphnia galeata]